MRGYKRADGRIGIRNHVAVVYTVECARFVAECIVHENPGSELWGFAGCYSDPYAFRMLVELGQHPNVAAVLLVSLGCESTDLVRLAESIRDAGKRVEVITIQEVGGTLRSLASGTDIVRSMQVEAEQAPQVPITWADLIVGIECGGSDATSGLSANPTTGWAVDQLLQYGATVIFSEIPELLGTDPYLLARARDEVVRQKIGDALDRARVLGNALNHFAISVGNQSGGLTTIEEKSLGALAKAGTQSIDGVLKTAERPTRGGLYLLDKVGDVGGNQLTHYEINDNDGLVSLIASGAHLLVFTTGRGSVVGSAIAPVIKICGNPETCRRMVDDIDVDAHGIIEGTATIEQVGNVLLENIQRLAGGHLSKSERLGHKEYCIPYKPGRACDVS